MKRPYTATVQPSLWHTGTGNTRSFRTLERALRWARKVCGEYPVTRYQYHDRYRGKTVHVCRGETYLEQVTAEKVIVPSVAEWGVW